MKTKKYGYKIRRYSCKHIIGIGTGKFKFIRVGQNKRTQRLYGKNYITEKFTYKEKKNSNGETLLELLARSRYFFSSSLKTIFQAADKNKIFKKNS